MDLIVIAILSAHLLLVDLAMAGPLLALWLDCRAARGLGNQAVEVAASLIRWSAVSLAVALAIGTVLLAHFWNRPEYADYFAALRLVPASRLWLGIAEVAFYFGCLAVYWIQLRRPKTSLNRRRLVRVLPVMAATDLMFHFPPLFAIVSVLANRPQQRSVLSEGLSRSEYYALLLDSEVLARVVHVWLAAIAVAGAVAIVLAFRRTAVQQNDAPKAIATSAARWSAAATLAQVPAGLWLTFSMSDDARDALFGGNLLNSGLFVVGVLLSLVLLHLLSSASLGDIDGPRGRRIVAMMSMIIVLMVGTLHLSTRRSRTAAGADGRQGIGYLQSSTKVIP